MSFLENFHYQISGPPDGDKLVFLHGLMGYAQNWRKIVQSFEDKYEILVYDQRGHGRSFQPLTGYSPDDYAEDLYLILEELRWQKCFLVGHSMGGRNALNFAHRFPNKVEKLVIEDIGPENDTAGLKRYTKLLEMIPTPFVSKLRAKEFFLNDFIHLSKNGEKPQMLGQYLYSNIIEMPDGTADWRFSKNAILSSLNEGRLKNQWLEFESLKMPTLVIRGANSRDLKSEVYAEMLKRNTVVKGVEIANAGHWVHYDQPQAFVEVLREFLYGL
jgi:pimeloyl-ACP methyl ester carboxylesterase